MKIAATAVARRLTGLHPVGSSNSDKFVFFFSCQNWILVRHRVFFFFFSILEWRSSISIFSQIWRYSENGSRKS